MSRFLQNFNFEFFRILTACIVLNVDCTLLAALEDSVVRIFRSFETILYFSHSLRNNDSKFDRFRYQL